MSIFTNFSKVWSHIKTSAETLFTDVEKKVQDFINPLLHQIIQCGGEVLVSAATQAVVAAETSSGTNEEKFAAAVASVKATLKTQGLPQIENAIHGAVTAAVAQLHTADSAATDDSDDAADVVAPAANENEPAKTA